MDKATGKQPTEIDIDDMPEAPQHRGVYHRRALSDTSYRLDDFLMFDPSDLDLSALDLLPSPTNPQATPVQHMSVDSSDDSSSNQYANSSQTPNPSRPKAINHLRSLSVDSDFFDSLGLSGAEDAGKNAGTGTGAREKRSYHRHSNSMDGSSFEVDSIGGDGFSKRTVDRDRLAELSLIDPKRAKRILANRQSAARSKERKIRYTSELERKVQTLQTEATNLSAKVTMMQRDTNELNNTNKELKLRLQAMEDQAKLRNALSTALKEEVQRLKMTATQMVSGNANHYSGALPPQFPQHQVPMQHQFGGHQAQQQQQHQHQHQHQHQQQQQHQHQHQHQQQMPQPSTNNNQTLSGQSHPNFMN